MVRGMVNYTKNVLSFIHNPCQNMEGFTNNTLPNSFELKDNSNMITHICIYVLETEDLLAIMPLLFWGFFHMFGVLVVSIINHMASCMTYGPLNNNCWERNKTCGLYDFFYFNSINKS
jgi:hypothetical protein